MIKKTIFGAVAVAMTLTAGLAFAEVEMEKCKVVDKAGKGLIKENKADGTMPATLGANQNKAWDAEAWINVPKGMCAKINEAVAKGDMSAVPADVKDKLEMSAK